jgi:hypothetical protein
MRAKRIQLFEVSRQVIWHLKLRNVFNFREIGPSLGYSLFKL